MLPVAVHEQYGAETGMIEPGKQRGLLAEIARQRDELDVESFRSKCACRAERGVAAAVVDVNHLRGQAARCFEGAGDFDDAGMQSSDIVGLVEQWHHDRQTGV